MKSGTRGAHTYNAPFVMHLERVCRLMELGQRFTVEFNPCCDVEIARVIGNLELHVHDGGDISVRTMNGAVLMAFNLTLGNYKKVWRCWQNGTPTEAQRRAVKWG